MLPAGTERLAVDTSRGMAAFVYMLVPVMRLLQKKS